jgi:hypothetical protein
MLKWVEETASPAFNEVRERAIKITREMPMPPSTWQKMLPAQRTFKN